jgi:hypothetical protein
LHSLLLIFFQNIEFDVNVFTPYLAVVVSSLVQLIAEADTTDGKLRIVRCLDTVIQHTGKNVCAIIFPAGIPLIGPTDPASGTKHHETSASTM